MIKLKLTREQGHRLFRLLCEVSGNAWTPQDDLENLIEQLADQLTVKITDKQKKDVTHGP